jgi:hypothetical protein
MRFQYVSVDEAIKRSGVRMVVVSGVPSPLVCGWKPTMMRSNRSVTS